LKLLAEKNRGVQGLRKLRIFVQHAKNNWVKS